MGRCKLHGGSSPNGQTYAAKQAALAQAVRFGVALDTPPHELLATITSIHAGHIATLQRLAERIEDGDEIVAGDLHPIIRALNAVLEPSARVAKMAIDAGVEGRRQRDVERLGGQIFHVIRGVLEDLGIAQDERYRERLPLFLRQRLEQMRRLEQAGSGELPRPEVDVFIEDIGREEAA